MCKDVLDARIGCQNANSKTLWHSSDELRIALVCAALGWSTKAETYSTDPRPSDSHMNINSVEY